MLAWRKLHDEQFLNKYFYYENCQTYEDDISKACSMHGKEGNCIQNVSPKRRRYPVGLDVDKEIRVMLLNQALGGSICVCGSLFLILDDLTTP